MVGKRFSEMDMALMELQKMGNDEFRLGFQYPGETKEITINEAIKTLQRYLDEHKNDAPEDAPYGYIIKVEFFKKGKPKAFFE